MTTSHTVTPNTALSSIAMDGPARPVRRRAPTIAAAAVTLLLTSWWAFAPLNEPDIPGVIPVGGPSSVPPADVPASRLALDSSAFNTPLWVELPAPSTRDPASLAPPPPPPPLRLQLLAIVHDEAGYRAMLYDPDTDRVLVAAEGEVLGGRTLTKVDTTRIEMLDHGAVRTLSLKTEAPASASGGLP